MQQRPAGGADVSGSMPDPLRQPTEYLLAFLNRVAILDKEGFFQRPVREEEAPNYYSIIKQPMCFADMREKIVTGAYQTWRQLRDDFNLIHENARRFNSNKTLVHRAALNLQKNGTKILANHELEVRKALAVLHPLGAGAGAPGQPSAAPGASAADARMNCASSPLGPGHMLGPGADQNGDVGGGADGVVQRTSLSGPPSPEAGAGADGGMGLPPSGSIPQPFPSALVSPAPRDPIVGYISDEDDQPLLVAGTDAACSAAAAAASRSLPGLAPAHVLPLDALLAQLRTSAVRVPYARPGRRKDDTLGGPSGLANAAAEDAAAAAGGEGPPGSAPRPPTGAGARTSSREWRRARRPVELRARWLELRMLELRSQQERLQSQITWLQQRNASGGEGFAGAALAAGLGRPAVGVLTAAAGLAAAPCGVEREALAAAAGEFLAAGRVSGALYFRLRATPPVAPAAARPADRVAHGANTVFADSAAPSGAVVSEALAGAATAAGAPAGGAGSLTEPPPVIGAPSAVTSAQTAGDQGGAVPSQLQSAPGGQSQPPQPVSPSQQPPADEGESDKMLPGAIFASLDLLEQRLSVVRSRLQESYKFDPNRLAMGRTQGPYAGRVSSYQLHSSGSLAAAAAAGGGPQQLLSSGAGAAAAAAHGAVKRQSSGQGRRPASLTVLTRFDSMSLPSCKSTGTVGGGKRKRSEVELLTGDMGTPLATYGRTSMDRSASMGAGAIVIPPVRELAPDEFRARIVAATTWSQHYHTTGPSALENVPPEIVTVLRKRRRRQGFCLPSGDDFAEELGLGAAGFGRGGGFSLSLSDDEALLMGGPGGMPAGAYSDSGVGDEEGTSSSSEDTSDEAYAARHRIMEEDEHRRYAAVMAEGQRRRNKGGNNANQQNQNQGGGSGAGPSSQAKDRAKIGNKTPRYSNSFKLKEGLMLVPPEIPPDGADFGPPSSMYSYYPSYPSYQPSMVGGPMASATLPPTPGSATAALLAHPQPVVVPQAVAQRTSSPPAVLQISPPGAGVQALQRQLTAGATSVATSTAAMLPPQPLPPTSPSAALAVPGPSLAGPGRPPAQLPRQASQQQLLPQLQNLPPQPLQEQPAPQPQPQQQLQQQQTAVSHQQQQPPSVAQPLPQTRTQAEADGLSVASLELPPPSPPPPPGGQPADSKSPGPHPDGQEKGQGQQKQPPPPLQQSTPQTSQPQQQPPLPQHQQQQERQSASHAQKPDGVSLVAAPASPLPPPAKQQQGQPVAGQAQEGAAGDGLKLGTSVGDGEARTGPPSGADAAPSTAAEVPTAAAAAAVTSNADKATTSTGAAAQGPPVCAASLPIVAEAREEPPGEVAPRAGASSQQPAPDVVDDGGTAGAAAGGNGDGATATPQAATTAPASATAASAAAAAATATETVAEAPSGAGTANGAAPAAAAAAPAVAASQGQLQLASLAGLGGQSAAAVAAASQALLANPTAAAMIAQSPAMSMQFLSGVPGLSAGTGTGGSLTAAATSILLAAAAAAQAGGQSAASSLMGTARSNALQQLAAGTPAAQVFANAAAAAAAAAAAGAGAGAPAAAGAGGVGQQGKAQQAPPLFTAASTRSLASLQGSAQNQAALAAAAAAGGLGGLGGIGNLPAAFQSFHGFSSSLAGVPSFNLNLAGGGLGLGLASGQRLPDGLGGMGMISQGAHQQLLQQQLQQLQQHHQQQLQQQQQQQLQGMPAPAPAQRQGQTGQAEGGRGGGRGRRTSRAAAAAAAVVEEDDDEDWEEDDDEEEEAASPSSRTRRSARMQRRGSNGLRGVDGHGNGGAPEATRQPRRRAAKGAHNWAVLLASDSSDDEEDEEWASRSGGRRPPEGGRGRGRGRRSAG